MPTPLIPPILGQILRVLSFKITSYDEYDLSNFNWGTSSALSDEGTLPYEAVNSAEEMLLIKDIAQTTSAMNAGNSNIIPYPAH